MPGRAEASRRMPRGGAQRRWADAYASTGALPVAGATGVISRILLEAVERIGITH